MKTIKFIIILLIAISWQSFVLAANQPSEIEIGKDNELSFKLPDQSGNGKCNIEVKLPDGKTFEKDVAAPDYEVTLALNPQNEGLYTIEWKGKLKLRGISSVFACKYLDSPNFSADAHFRI